MKNIRVDVIFEPNQFSHLNKYRNNDAIKGKDITKSIVD
jgi:hypothetical protein